MNDSAALKQADVGFSMGSGSEVAKEASDIVILDDNFASITQAIKYGRTIYRSIQKFIVFQSTVNLASGAIVFLGPFLGFDFPLTLIQLLWVNLVMDTLAALAFGGEPALESYMKQKPIQRNANIIDKYMYSAILVNGISIAIACIYFLTSKSVHSAFGRQVEGKLKDIVFFTAFFAFFIFCTAWNAFNVRVKSINITENIFLNKGFLFVITLIFIVQISFSYIFGEILRTVSLTFDEWFTVISSSSFIIPIDILRKLAFNSFLSKRRKLN